MLLLLPAVLALFVVASSLRAEPIPHPDLPDRLIDTREGFSVEYSPGDEAYVEAVFEGIEPLRDQLTRDPSSREPDTFLPLSALDMRARRDAILTTTAASIGLDEATVLQGEVYDAFLRHYELQEVQAQEVRRFTRGFRPHGVTIWHRKMLTERLKAGELIPNFTYDAIADQGSYELGMDSYIDRGEKQDALRNPMENTKLGYQFWREDADDTTSFAASVTFGNGDTKPEKNNGVPTLQELINQEGEGQQSETLSFVLPLILSSNDSPLSNEIAKAIQEIEKHLPDLSPKPQYRDNIFVAVILHETAEVGLIERYIRSPDRRWLCDGTANWVSWKVARDFAGGDFAQFVYNLDQQLADYADLQRQIKLSRWAAKTAAEVGMDERLSRAPLRLRIPSHFQFCRTRGRGRRRQALGRNRPDPT